MPNRKKEIVKILSEARRPNKIFRQSRELIDNKLNRDNENKNLKSEDVFNTNEKGIFELPETIIRCLDLDQGEDRLVHTLTLLLSRKSENRDQKSSDYYMGNYADKASIFL